MVVFNYSGAEINAKVVYYGPALSGKTTNLEYIYEKMPADAKGKMVSMKTRTDRTLFFDFLPLELGDISGYRTRMLLYTVPGQVYYNATRKLVLKGADAVVFVADSTPAKMEENVESLRNLEENLNEHGLTLDTIPWVIQYNKRDVDGALPVKALSDRLNPLNVPVFEAVATVGTGIYETFEAIAGMLYNQLIDRLSETQQPRKKSKETAAPAPAKRAGKKAAQKAAAPPSDDDERSVTDVVDVALREIDDAETAQPVPPPPPKPKPKVKPKAAPEKRPPARRTKAKAPVQEEKMDEIDETVGRVIDLEDTESSPAEETADGEFVLDPFQSSERKEAAPAKTARPKPPLAPRAAPPPPPVDGDEVCVSVPVVITRSQMKKNIPLKISLEIQVVDEEV
jgi:signal recognition particle receptor subunit beta